MANRQERIISVIKKNITDIIHTKVKDPHLGFLTITDIDVSSDLSYAKVYVSFIDKKIISSSMRILDKLKGFVRSELAKTLDTRRVPIVSFELDDSYEKGQRIEEILNNDKK